MSNATARDLHHQFTSKERSAKEITKESLKAIREKAKNLGAFISVFEERALEKANELDKKRASGMPLGKLAGVPIAIKDNISLRGELCTCASNILKNYRAPYDATAVSLIEEQDGLIIGKTNLDEFAMGSSGKHSAFYPTKNPWNETYSPGGSSSGSAAAVAAGFCPLALGSDTGGSVREPASFCGLVGFKPTYGRISRYGLVAFGSSFDQIAPFGRTVKDVALMMEVLGHHCEKDSTSLNLPPLSFDFDAPVKGKRIGVPYAFIERITPEMRTLFDQSLKVLTDLGAEIVELNLPLMEQGIAVYYVLAVAEASTNLARFDGIRYGHRSPAAKNLEEVYELSREEGFGFEVKNRILLGTYLLSSSQQEIYFRQAQKVRTLMIQEVKTAFESCDFIALPTCPGSAFKIGYISDSLQEYLQDLYTVPANVTGMPAISLPASLSSEGLPVGFQLIGPHTSDAALLQLAHSFEMASPFPKRGAHNS